jgi:hypothetical protein
MNAFILIFAILMIFLCVFIFHVYLTTVYGDLLTNKSGAEIVTMENIIRNVTFK